MAEHVPIRLSARDIVFENADYLAVAKKRGWLVHPTVDPQRPNLLAALRAHLRSRAHGAESYLALHHRLDVDTSGVIVFARSERANPVLAEVFAKRLAHKVYEAVCVGAPPADAGELVDFLAPKRIRGRDTMVKVARGGKKAITRYRCLETRGGLSRVSFELVTGRRHQIRAQAALAGFPILGDDHYGDAAENRRRGIHQHRLHARHLSFDDPLSGQRLGFEAPVPRDFALEPPSAAPAPQTVLFYKPFGVLCQFTPDHTGGPTLADFGLPPDVYPAGRLDKDSEGLVLLTADGALKDRLASPRGRKDKRYWVQVEGEPSDAALAQLAAGVEIQGKRTRPCRVRRIEPPVLPPRDPPIRSRKHIPAPWLEIVLTEGRNRQIRRMTAAVGHPTLRLVRVAIDRFALGDLQPGQHRAVADLTDSLRARQ